MWPNLHETLVAFTEEILNEKFIFYAVQVDSCEIMGQSYILNFWRFLVEIFKRGQRYDGKEFNAVIDPSSRHVEQWKLLLGTIGLSSQLFLENLGKIREHLPIAGVKHRYSDKLCGNYLDPIWGKFVGELKLVCEWRFAAKQTKSRFFVAIISYSEIQGSLNLKLVSFFGSSPQR